ncbi:MAG: hypothetical protein IJI09_01945, partial [Clostridia bacterium]|nr:hypothetical protein [Clostridia bacterium]
MSGYHRAAVVPEARKPPLGDRFTSFEGDDTRGRLFFCPSEMGQIGPLSGSADDDLLVIQGLHARQQI